MEESSKLTLIISILVAVFLGGLGSYVAIADREAANRTQLRELQSLKEGLAQLHVREDEQTKRLEAAKNESAALKKQEETVTSLTAEKTDLEKQIKDLEAERQTTRADFLTLIQKVRGTSVGLEFPQVTLPGDKVLKTVRVKSVADTEIVVTHDLGVTRIPLANLPDELKQRFWIGRAPIAEIDAENLGKTPAVVANSAPPPPLEKNARPKLSDLQGQVRLLEQQKTALEASYRDAKGRESDFRSKALVRGPINSYGVNAERAAAEAAQYKVQMDAVARRIIEIQNMYPQADKD